jgi:biotin carboxyl carrier protein
MEKYRVTVNGKEHIVELDELANVDEIKEVILNGKKCSVDVNFDELGSIVVNNNTHKINSIFEFDGEPVKFLIGKDFHDVEVEEMHPLKKVGTSEKKKDGKVVAPMPGKILEINVNEGDEVRANQDVIILEAMKMENRLKSPINGIVKKISTEKGATCNARDLLMIIE